MADTTLTGAETEVTVDKEKAVDSSDRKKKLMKYALIAVGAVVVFFLVKKFILKK